MINRNNVQVDTPSFLPKWSDEDVLRSVLNPELSRMILTRDPKFFWLVLKGLIVLKIEVMAAPIRAILHFDFGKRTTGIFITVMSILMLVAFNSKTLFGISANIIPVLAPILPFFMDGEQISQSALGDIRSQNLMAFWMFYSVVAIIHLVMIYRRKAGRGHQRNQHSITSTSRGISILHRLIFVHLKVSEHIVQLIIEPGIVFTIGYILMATSTDMTFGLWLVIGSICLFGQELYDAVNRFVMQNSIS